MNPIAVASGSVIIYWSAIVIALGLLSALFMTLSLCAVSRERSAGAFLLLPLLVALSVPLCRILHYNCHAEQYSGLVSALTDYSTGSYCLPGAILGVWLAALICAKLRLVTSTAALLDAFAPAAALSIAFIRLSALFNSSCRSKIAVQNKLLQRLPFASGITNSAGETEYRFATFFVQFLLLLVICYMLLRFFLRRRDIPMKYGRSEGNTARMFLLFYSACELFMDSTRYDSSFFHFSDNSFLQPLNAATGFISSAQLTAAVCITVLLVYYCKHSVRGNGAHPYHLFMCVGYLLSIGAVGISEYLVQRHGDWYMGCYTAMVIGSIMMAAIVYRMYKTCCRQ